MKKLKQSENDFRVVVDTNVLISGLFGIKNSPSAHVLQAIRKQKVILVTSPLILEEISNVFNRERIAKLIKMTKSERTKFLDMLIERADVTAGRRLPQAIGRDEKDDKFLACAIEGKVNYLITGDKDLLDLGEFEGIKIITPRKFMVLFPLDNFKNGC